MRPSRKLPEKDGKQHYERNETGYHKSQSLIYAHHRDVDRNDYEAVLNEVDYDIGEHHRNGVGVVGYARNELSDGHFVELSVRKTLYMREKVFSYTGNYLLSGYLKNHGLDVGADKRNNEKDSVDYYLAYKVVESEILPHHSFDIRNHKRRGYRKGDRNEHNQHNRKEILRERLRVADEPADKFAVLHFTVETYGFGFVLHR